MKELSIKQKAERYDEISKEVKDFFDGKQKMYSDVEQTLNHLFPELGESDDEKIRKDIIRVLKGEISFVSEKENEKYIAWIEKQGEQKPANKVEPKFREGDWVVYNHDICQIVKREEGCNKLVTVFGIEKELVNERNLSTAHLWTIQDANDGDVLCCESGWTCIFKELNSDMSFSSYCFMDDTGWFCETGSESHTLDKAFIKTCNGNIYPATKEQRDLLFSKMKEVGYEWDADKKELKVVDWRKHIEYNPNAPSTAEEKPTWTGEDEQHINSLLKRLDGLCRNEFERTRFAISEDGDWLKSLKQRMGV